MSTWLVTGGAGFIGSHITRDLVASGFNVIVIDDFTTGLDGRLPREVEVVRARISEICKVGSTKVSDHFNSLKIDGVIHTAGLKNARDSVLNPMKYWENNVIESINLLQWVVKMGIPNFIFSSSCSVYGNQSNVTEESRLNPVSPYGHTKAACEQIISSTARQEGYKFCCLRYFNVVGCGSFPFAYDNGADNVVPIFIKKAIGNMPLQIYGSDKNTADGTCVRDYVDVRDISSAHLMIASRMSRQYEVPELMNVGSGNPVSVLEVANTLRGCLPHLDVLVERHPGRSGDPDEVWAAKSLFAEQVGWKCEHTLEDSIRASLDSYKKNT